MNSLMMVSVVASAFSFPGKVLNEARPAAIDILRIDAPTSAPIVSNLWCTSSTLVASGPSAVKRTSTLSR
jgi:hypothetical protein